MSCPPPLTPRPRWDSRIDHTPAPACNDAQGYTLQSTQGRITINATTSAGVFYAQQTLMQLQRQYPDGIPDIHIVDWPATQWRGVMLDVSRDKVPTMASMCQLIMALASLKINVLQLYLEHTFAHPGHDDVWRDASPFTPSEIAQLRHVAAAHHVMLIGQQNTLGHMERWLTHPRYADLAALPGGYHAPDGGHEPAACLEPTNPAALALACELVTTVAETFACPTVHIGLDEPIDLNPAVWDAIFDVPGTVAPWAGIDNGAFCVPLAPTRQRDYVHWIQAMCAIPALQHRQVLMWADVIAAHPALMADIPAHVTLVEWGYEADHPFAARVERIRAAGRTCWVAPGTAAWNSLAGRIPTMQANIQAAVAVATTHQLPGLLICDWGNAGHMHYAPISWPGFVYGAALSWNPHDTPNLTASLAHICPHPQLATLTVQLGRIGHGVLPPIKEAGTLAALLTRPEAIPTLVQAGMSAAFLTAIADELDDIRHRCTPFLQDATCALWADELATTAHWLRLGVAHTRHLLGWDESLSRAHIRRARHTLLAHHRTLWLARNRIGGLEDSVTTLAQATHALDA